MLGDKAIVAFAATAKADEARTFYEEVLGLRFVADAPFALVFDANGTTLRLQKVEAVGSGSYTVLGWEVSDIAVDVRALAARGVQFERYAWFEQDADGVWTTPEGAKIAWFKDPDGNLLSLSQGPSR